MINLENLNDKTEIEIFDEARKKINIINPDWTYQGESDPGITLLELLSWLKFSQHEYLNKISPLTEIKLLKLLGINLKKRRGSRTLIQISNLYVDMDVPKNTKWFADKLVFENNHEQFLVKSDVLSLKFVNPEFENIENFYNLDGTKKIFLFGENNLKFNEQREFFINLSSPFPKDKTVNLYFEIFQSNEFTRNQIDPTCFYPMAKINWQYWGTTSEKKIKWVDLEFNDFTNQFLFSGIVSIKHYGKMEPLNGIYCIKVKLINSDYDFMPQITKINLNVFEVIQKDTKCESIFIKKNEIKSSENKMKIQIYTHLSIYGEQILYIKKKKSWVIFKNFNTSKNYKDGYLSIFFDSLDNLENFEDDEYVFMLISFSNDIKDKIIIGNATGFSGLTFNTNFEDTPIHQNFKIMVGEEKDDELFFKVWERVEDFFSSSKFDDCFVFEENIGLIAFGNNIKGKIPKKGKNNIRICELCYTKGESSNIKDGMINDIESNNKSLKNSCIEQIVPAIGGRNNETLGNATKRVSEIFNKLERAVTTKDYEHFVNITPGMILKSVSVFSKEQNKITVAVQIKNLYKIPNSCKKTISKWLERYRLLNTKIDIIAPTVINLNITAKIAVNYNYDPKKFEIQNEIKIFLKKLNNKMGQSLIYSKIFRKIEKLKSVVHIHELKINTSGKHVFNERKNISEDIVVPFNGVYHLEKIDLICNVDADYL